MVTVKVLLILALISNIGYVLSKIVSVFPIVGLFDKNTMETTQSVFEELTQGNPRSGSSSTVCTGRILVPTVSDTYSIALEVCRNTSGEDAQVTGLVDARPTDGYCDATCLLCNRIQIPHLSIGWGPIEDMQNYPYSFSYYPPPHIVSKAFASLIQDLGWQRFTLFYEDDSSFIRLQKVIDSWPPTKFPITFQKLVPKTKNGQNRETFKFVIKTEQISHHVIDCDIDNILDYMQEILDVENSTRYQSFLLTNLDAHLINMSSIPSMVANISTFFMTNEYRLETALAYDALKHLRLSMTQMSENKDNSLNEESNPPEICFNLTDKWADGENLRNYLREVTADGKSGRIQFDDNGERTNFTVYFKKMNEFGNFVYAGEWNSHTEMLTKNDVKDRSETQSGKFTVISRKGLPYFNITEDESGNRVYTGYVVDLLTEIFKVIKNENNITFELVFREVKDGLYGNPKDGTGKWDGIMGELMDHTADLGTCDLTITSERSTVVDFSTPFMTTGISMLFKKEEPELPRMFSFIDPLTVDVWLYLATTYIIVSFIFLICARMSNLDWVNPHPCNRNPENLENIWSFYNCTWFAMGTIMTQGCDILPRGLGSRWIAGMWWFFAMILTASYTANMATFLKNSRLDSDIKNAKDLSEQTKVQIGAVLNASTYKFFKDSADPVYSKIWEQMNSARPSVFMSGNEEGKDRVLKTKDSKYAFFMESTMVKYYMNMDEECRLKMVGPPLDYKAYGIAMPKNFPQKAYVDSAIIKLQERGVLATLESKWWQKDKVNCGKEEEDDGSLQMKNTSGIFLVLGVGGILGLIIAIVDFLLHANRIAVQEKLTFKEAVKSEWNASLNPRKLAKPVAPPRSAPESTKSPSPRRERSTSRAVSVLRAASSFINFDEIY